ncbi:CTLH/CRA C-terminal to lish motif domain-containing protein [Amylostereum chailletii]|nr:CTLH/CRA C-terminal to lish motif domain-containing protein [Amylostereum chailletii]
MSSNQLHTEGVMLFEQPFARVPYENYRKVFRASQKNIEREFTAVQSSANDLAGRHGQDVQEVLSSFDAMIGRVEGLKRKLSDLQDTAGSSTQSVMRDRLLHLKTIDDIQTADDPRYIRWADTRLDRWLVDWSLRRGKEKTARLIASEKGIETLVDIELFMDIRRIEDALRKHSCAEALAWCNENKAALRKAKSTLEFDLRLQEYIELARARKTLEAIAYSKKYLIPWQETHLAQIKQASALLAYPAHTPCSPYKRLYDPSRWEALVRSLRLTIFNLNTLPSEPLLHLALYGGLASLKLPSCYDHETKNPDCPVCDPWLGKLAEEVPFSHHVISTIVCRISGKIMNEDNPPMAFPNGSVYSRQALEDMASKNDGKVTCPHTLEECDFSKLRKVFIS